MDIREWAVFVNRISRFYQQFGKRKLISGGNIAEKLLINDRGTIQQGKSAMKSLKAIAMGIMMHTGVFVTVVV